MTQQTIKDFKATSEDLGLTLDPDGKDTSHLISHLEECYIHGSLIFRALQAAGYINPPFILAHGYRDNIVRAVRKYFRKALGLVR
jgi:adenosylmethionine-8-amino-7-oxononanoate aminotransferase